MLPTELAQAIHKPLQVQASQEGKDKRWQPALVERLVEDVGDDATLLPLLQVTLTSLCDEPPQRLTLDHYDSLTDALREHAERAVDEDALGIPLTPVLRDAVMALFLDLVEVSLDDDPQRDVRRTVPRPELELDHPERHLLIDELIADRLLAAQRRQRRHHPRELDHQLAALWPRQLPSSATHCKRAPGCA